MYALCSAAATIYTAPSASWQSGHAQDCKSCYPGSTPGEASKTLHAAMTGSDFPVHGGDLAFATRTYGQPDGGWLDLSTGVNPTPYPVPAELLTPDVFHRLPDTAALARLEAIARGAYNVPAGAGLAAVPGSETAIHLLPRLAPAGARAFILAPTYSSHTSAWPAATRVTKIDEIPDSTIAILANPNNPDGRVFAPEALSALARRAAWLIVDEAFADVAPGASLIPTLPENALVLRSVGKFYGLAGLRLGFVVGANGNVANVAAALGAWAVSGPAIAIGAAVLADTRWREATRLRLSSEAAALRDLLARCDLRVAGGTDLFVLVETDDAHALHRGLAQRGIWTRAFAEQPSWLRLGLPGVSFARLESALTDLQSAPRA